LELGGNSYPTVIINKTIWMAENLELLVQDSWFYNDNAENGKEYGMLYTWDAAVNTCPDGWELPKDEDWEELFKFLGNDEKAVKRLMEKPPEGINLKFGGYRTIKGDFMSLERAADYWTANSAGDLNAWLRYVIYKKEKFFRIIDDKRSGFSVRYIKRI
jgi:uncharacterized protein (TIGR02145 family)